MTLAEQLQIIYKGDYHKELGEKFQNLLFSYQRERGKTKKWDENDAILITYGDSVREKGEFPLKTLNRFLVNYLKEQFTVVHVLPFFPYSSDDGFSVIDFRKVNSELGDWEDIESLGKNFDLMIDLVINHASSKSSWFQNFLKQKGEGSDYFISISPETDLSEVTRPRSTPLLTAFDTTSGKKHVWTTFSADQADLDFTNPDLLMEMLDIMLFYISKGARIIRLDAIAFLWKKQGTSCLHLEETHEVVKLLRKAAEFIDPSAIIITETNVPNKENLSYFGNGDEAHMVYQFSLPPLLLHGLHTGNSGYITSWAAELPQLKKNQTFFNFTASHDGIGVRPLEGLLPQEELFKLAENMKKFGGLVSYRSNPDGSTSPYELNISYFDALKGTSKGKDAYQAQRFLVSQGIMMSMAGIPAFYIHSLTTTPNYTEGVAETGMNRTINRRKWNLEEVERRILNDELSRYVFNQLKHLINLRKKQKAFHPNASQKILKLDEKVFGLIREASNGEKVLALFNFTNQKLDIEFSEDFKKFNFDLVSGKHMVPGQLDPYQFVWMVRVRDF